MKNLFFILALTITAAIAKATPYLVVPGAIWRDTAGNIIQAHGAGLIHVGKTYYWFGEDHTGQKSDQSFLNIPCYASQDLVHWTLRGNALTRQSSGDLGPDRAVERPKVIYNRRTHMYVMYLHIDSKDYHEAKVGVATSRKVEGPYTYRQSFQPLGHQSRDMTVFQDTDGRAYLIHEDRMSGVRIDLLSADYLSVAGPIALIPQALEGNCVLHVKDTYFMLGSHLTGWAMNPDVYATAPALSGPWSEFANVAPPSTNTYNSQSAFILPVQGAKATSYLYIGDRWKGDNLQDSRYIWMPLAVNDKTLSLAPDVPFTLDAAAGTMTFDSKPQ